MSKSDTRTALDWYKRSQRNEKDLLLKETSDELGVKLKNLDQSSFRFMDEFVELSETYTGYSREIETLLNLSDEQSLQNLTKVGGTGYIPEDIRKYKVMTEILYATGARAGDIENIRFKDLDFEKGEILDRKSTRLNSSHSQQYRMPSSA